MQFISAPNRSDALLLRRRSAVGSRRRHRLSQFKVAAKTVATDLLSCRAACFELLSRQQLEAQPQARAQRDSGTAGQAAQLDSWTRGLNSTKLNRTGPDWTELNVERVLHFALDKSPLPAERHIFHINADIHWYSGAKYIQIGKGMQNRLQTFLIAENSRDLKYMGCKLIIALIYSVSKVF